MSFFAGDTDGAVPDLGTRGWLRDLNWDIKEMWKPWMINDQVAGMIEQYDGMDFITVKGVGHMAPQWARLQVTTAITNWINNRPID